MSQPEAKLAVPGPKLRWYQFSLRSLFVMIAVIAFGLGYVWWEIDSYTKEWREEQLAIEEVEDLTGWIIERTAGTETEAVGPEWLRCIVPEANRKIFNRVTAITFVDWHFRPSDRNETEALAAVLRRFKQLRRVEIINHCRDYEWYDCEELKRALGEVHVMQQYSE